LSSARAEEPERLKKRAAKACAWSRSATPTGRSAAVATARHRRPTARRRSLSPPAPSVAGLGPARVRAIAPTGKPSLHANHRRAPPPAASSLQVASTAHQVPPVHRSLQRRGRAACRSEWRLITATHNLVKLWRHTTCRRRPEAPARRSSPIATTLAAQTSRRPEPFLPDSLMRAISSPRALTQRGRSNSGGTLVPAAPTNAKPHLHRRRGASQVPGRGVGVRRLLRR
jgi:hypothetical protein